MHLDTHIHILVNMIDYIFTAVWRTPPEAGFESRA
jgi:hypothetical protein